MAITVGIKESDRSLALTLQIARLQRSLTISILNFFSITNDHGSRSNASEATTKESYCQ